MAARLPTIQEVQQLVDDPKIDDETKRTLLVRYFDAIGDHDPVGYGFRNENEKKQLLESYQDRFGFTDRDLTDGAFAYDAYSAAQGKHDANMQAAREAQARAVDDGKARLDSLKGTDTSAGAANSNEILDAGAAGLDSFRTWLPVYSRARAVAAPGLPDFRLPELIDRYDEQRDIPFDKFAAGVAEIVQVRESVADAAPSQNSAMQALFGSWDGDGKNAAAASWTKFGDGVKTVEQALEHAADVVNRTIAAVAGSCRDKASWVLQYAFQTWPQQQGLTAQDTDRLTRIAELGRNASADDFKHFIPFLIGQHSPLAGQLLMGSSFGMSDELLDAVQAWAKSWLAQFCGWFAGFVGEFQSMCENTRVAVAAQWAALNTELQKVPDNPFAAVGEAAAVPARTGAGGSGRSGGGSGGAAGAGGGGLAGGAAGAGGAGSAGVGSADGLTGGAAAPPPAAAPIVPPAVAPVAPVPDEQDTLTVQRGDSKLEMSEPDQTGRMAIKIDTGDGRPKDYQLTWGTPDPANPAHTPAADGKIHIDEGPLHITAERPTGGSGPTVITIDDGTGPPTTYTLGEEPAPSAGAGAAAPLAEAAQRSATAGAFAPGSLSDAAERSGTAGAFGTGSLPEAAERSATAGAFGTASFPDAAERLGTAGAFAPEQAAEQASTTGAEHSAAPSGAAVHGFAPDAEQTAASGGVAAPDPGLAAASGGLAGHSATPATGDAAAVGSVAWQDAAQAAPGGAFTSDAAHAAASAGRVAPDPGLAATGGAATQDVAAGAEPAAAAAGQGLASDSAQPASSGGASAAQTAPGVAGAGAPGFPGAGHAAATDQTASGFADGGAPGFGVQDQTSPASALGGVADGLGTQVSGSLGDPGSLSHSSAPAASGATLGTAPGLDPVGAAVDPGGMGMLGGMPPAAGQQGGDDPERTSRAYRVDGDIFDSPGSGGRISGSLDDEETRR
ncbi:hypothetical protein GCM10017786_31120 [Amycolatopsis deserti]|uniref:Uncharacterized protein n=1 Tax=Amycolatopsis deserti TaxID=185696 RepID=A0ABQ3J1C4_9PSEU|nr:hypothetical protein [Amycolatopsis deserti]GHE96334.1 hypothetical protein GCM10017786_31120 [Amycolatopsis deserti]